MVERLFWGVAMLVKLPGLDSWLRPCYIAALQLKNWTDTTFSKYNSIVVDVHVKSMSFFKKLFDFLMLNPY